MSARRHGLAFAIGLLVVAAVQAPALARPDSQWYLGFLNINTAHTISTGTGAVVALVDTGVDAGHPDLEGRILNGTDLLSPPISQVGKMDLNGHGTGMAGIIVGHGRIDGVAPGASILPIRATQGNITGFDTRVVDAIDWAVAHGAGIINISASSPTNNAALATAITRAIQANIIVVASAGNLPDFTRIGFPAALPGVVSVVGVDKNGQRASVSVAGPEAVIAAPAVDIVSTDIRTGGHNGYSIGTGTSPAAAIISGVAALIRSKYPNMSAAEVIHRMTATADDKGPPGRDSEYGYGIVNPVKALTADVPPLTSSPSASPSTAAPDGNDTGRLTVVLIGIAVALALLVAAFVAYRRST